KSRPSICSMNEKISPPTPQPKQWYVPRSGETKNEGVFSEWNGHRARSVEPALSNFTYPETTSTIESRSLICCTVSLAMPSLCSLKLGKAKARALAPGFARSCENCLEHAHEDP